MHFHKAFKHISDGLRNLSDLYITGVYELWVKHKYAAIQKNHEPNVIKEYDFLDNSFTFFCIFGTRLNSLNVVVFLN